MTHYDVVWISDVTSSVGFVSAVTKEVPVSGVAGDAPAELVDEFAF